jgi:2'-5' RNA ligase
VEKLLSVWLVPDDKKLTSTVLTLSSKYNSPSFIPHLTLLGEAKTTRKDLKLIVDDVFKDHKTFKVKTIGIFKSEAFFKTVFIEFEINHTLKNLYEKFSERTDKRSIDSFKPHISLMYKMMRTEDKLKVIKNLRAKKEYEIKAVYIVAPKIGDNDFMDVESWRIIYKKTLG